MPKKKKTPKNSFYFFMRDFKEEQEQMGYHFRDGMKEVADLAGPEWEKLPPAQRQHYEDMAAEYKLREKGNKFTTMGIPYAIVEKEKSEKMQSERAMKWEIQGTVQELDRGGSLKTHVFYFIHFNVYCQLDDGQYLICEVALAQFNFLQGVKDVYHTIVKQDKIPTGYSYAAKSTSESTHQIPLPHELTEGERPHGNIFIRIKSFLEQNKMANGQLPPLYTIDEHVPVAQSVMTELAEFHYPQNPDLFRVYPLSKLFYYLRNAAKPPDGAGFPVESLALRELEKDQYNFAPGIACDLHDKNDTCVFCSKSIVTRWGYLICDHCCKDLQISLVRGRHIPNNAAITEVDQEPFKFQESRRSRAPRPISAATNSSSTSSGSGTGTGSGSSTVSQPRVEHPSLPLHVVDYSKSGPPEDTAHHYNLNAASATPVIKPVGNCWGKLDGGPLRRPTKLPASVQDAIQFSSEDFPDLGSRNHSKSPAAVAGRGRGRARILHEERSPGDLIEDVERLSMHIASSRGRGRVDKPGSRLAANFQLN